MDPNCISWYCQRLEERKPFSLLTYGDGEFQVMMGEKTGQAYTTYEEQITTSLVLGLTRSLAAANPAENHPIIRATDLHLIDWTTYHGQDVHAVRNISVKIQDFLKRNSIAQSFVDGVIWDTAVKTGNLTQFLRVLHSKCASRIILVANPAMERALFLHPRTFVPVPPSNASSMLSILFHQLKGMDPQGIYIFCMGLGAIPLIMMLNGVMPQATFMDLGSTFDVFVGLDSNRGWRKELYLHPPNLRRIVTMNLDGVCGQDCGEYKVQSIMDGCSYYVRHGRVTEI